MVKIAHTVALHVVSKINFFLSLNMMEKCTMNKEKKFNLQSIIRCDHTAGNLPSKPRATIDNNLLRDFSIARQANTICASNGGVKGTPSHVTSA